MPDSSESERLRLAALQEDLEAARRKRDTYQALLKELPEVFEGKFRERVRPLLQRNERLFEEGLALREQVRRALPPADGEPLPSASLPPAGAPDRRSLEPWWPPSWWPRLGDPQRNLSRAARGVAVLAAIALPAAGLLLVPRLFGPDGAAKGPAPSLAPSGPRPGASRSADPSASPAPSPASLPSAASPATPSAAVSGQGAALKAQAGQPAPASLTIRTTGASWLEVRDGREALLYSGELRGVRVFPLTTPVRVRAGRADRVFVRVNGQPERRFGTIDFFDWVTFQEPPRPAALPRAASSPVPRRQP